MEAKECLLKIMATAEDDVRRLEAELRAAKARLGAFNESVTALGPSAVEGTARSVLRRLQDKVRKEESSLAELEAAIVDAQGRVSAFEEAIRLFPKEGEDTELRAGSEMHKVREVIRGAGKAMALTEILRALGAEGDDKKRNSLRGSLASYANKGRVFTKEEQSETFGLIEFRSETAKKG